jgi:hypothetical protein
VSWRVGVFMVDAMLVACASMSMLCVHGQTLWTCLFADLEIHGDCIKGPIIGRNPFTSVDQAAHILLRTYDGKPALAIFFPL